MDNDPILSLSRKDACVLRLERMILSGQVRIGQKLPPERSLAESFHVSRPVVHDALVDLAAKGLVQIKPRKGVIVKDFRTSGSPALLTSLFSYHDGELEPLFFESMVAMRLLLETEIARLAALHRSPEQVEQLAEILAHEEGCDHGDALALAELDFAFHQLLALASGNIMYLLVINSFKPIYVSITRRFFARHANQPAVNEVLDYHRRVLAAVAACDGEAAAAAMATMLHHGAANL